MVTIEKAPKGKHEADLGNSDMILVAQGVDAKSQARHDMVMPLNCPRCYPSYYEGRHRSNNTPR